MYNYFLFFLAVSMAAFAVSIAAFAVSIADFAVSTVILVLSVVVTFVSEEVQAVKPATAKIANTFFIVLVLSFRFAAKIASLLN